jgi:hypothetical protein
VLANGLGLGFRLVYPGTSAGLGGYFDIDWQRPPVLPTTTAYWFYRYMSDPTTFIPMRFDTEFDPNAPMEALQVAVTETASLKYSQTVNRTEAPSETASMLYSQTVKGAEAPSETIAVKASEVVAKTETAAELAALKYSQTARPAQSVAELAALKYSQTAKTAQSVAEAIGMVYSQTAKKTQTVAETSSVISTQVVVGSEHPSETAALKYSQTAKETQTVAETLAVKYSQTAKQTQTVAEASTLKTSQAVHEVQTLTELAGLKYSQHTARVETVAELANVSFSQKLAEQQHVLQTATLVVSGHFTLSEGAHALASLLFSQTGAGEGRLTAVAAVQSGTGLIGGGGIGTSTSVVVYNPPSPPASRPLTGRPGGDSSLLKQKASFPMRDIIPGWGQHEAGDFTLTIQREALANAYTVWDPDTFMTYVVLDQNGRTYKIPYPDVLEAIRKDRARYK